MLAKLLKSRRVIAPPRAVPGGERVYAIGDVHGCDALLTTLIEAIDADDRARGPAATTLIFLGDLVDRGPASAQVIERVLRLRRERPRVHCLLGNHEEVFLGALDGDAKSLRLFCRIGGRETALSYGLTAEGYERLDYDELAAALDRLVPAEHRRFLAGCEDMVVVGDYVFVHAGVRPGVAIGEQHGDDLRWIREPFLHHGQPLEKMVVHGHTISDGLDRQPHRIGVDTGAHAQGRLTAVGLEGKAVWSVEAIA